MPQIRWTINLEDLKNGTHVVTTSEGARRVGKITQINFTTQRIYDQEVKTPKSIELNHDSLDFIDWALITSISSERAGNAP